MQELVGLQLQMMDFTVQQLGRTAFVVVYINPLQAQEGAAIDGLRHHIDARCTAALGRPVRSEVILTVRPPIHRLDPTQRAALSVTGNGAVTMSDQQQWDAVVIGSGIGGLVTASQLAAKGARTLVLERYLIPGGSGGAFRRDGYTFDVGASMIFGFGEKGYTNLLTRALADIGEHCETIPDQAQLEYHMPGGLNIAVDRDYDSFIAELTARFPHEATGIRRFYDTCWQVFNCLDAMPLLSLEDPAYLTKVFFKAPLACLGLARWLPFNVGAVARQHIKDEQLLKFIDIECFCWSVMPADRTPMINAGMVFSDRHAGGINYPKGGGCDRRKTGAGPGAPRRRHPLQSAGHRGGDRERPGRWGEAGQWRGHRRPSGDLECHPLGHLSGDGGHTNGAGQALVDGANTPAKEQVWRRRYVPSPSFLSLHLGVKADLIPAGTHCHHLLLEDWERMEDEQGVIFVSMPSLLDPDLAPEGHHIVHTFTPSSMEAWQGCPLRTTAPRRTPMRHG